MTKEQAYGVVAILNAAFPREALEEMTVDLYASEIALLHDPGVGFEAARLTARQAERFPSIKEFRATYRSLAEAARAAVPALETPRWSTAIPEWVLVWWWLRRVRTPREERMVPQQDEHGFAPSMSLDEYEAYLAEWRAAGSPTVSGRELVESMAGSVGA